MGCVDGVGEGIGGGGCLKISYMYVKCMIHVRVHICNMILVLVFSFFPSTLLLNMYM